MKTVTVKMPQSDYLLVMQRLIELGAPTEVVENLSTNRTRIVATAIEPFLQKDGEEFLPTENTLEEATMFFRVKSFSKGLQRILNNLQKQEVISSYSV